MLIKLIKQEILCPNILNFQSQLMKNISEYLSQQVDT